MKALIYFVLVGLSLTITGCNKNKANSEPEPAAAAAKPAAPEPAAKPAPTPAAAQPAAKEPVASTAPQVELSTTMGKIKLELDPAKAPKTVENFLKYVRSGHYNGTIFHRVIEGFMIQGGGFDAKYNEKPTDTKVQNEADNGLSNKRGTISMARTPDPHSASAQFFINVVDNDKLDHTSKTMSGWGYCVFGKVIEGMDVVDKIKAVPTGSKGPFAQDAPQTEVVINEAKIVR